MCLQRGVKEGFMYKKMVFSLFLADFFVTSYVHSMGMYYLGDPPMMRDAIIRYQEREFARIKREHQGVQVGKLAKEGVLSQGTFASPVDANGRWQQWDMPFAEEKDFADYLAEQKKKSPIEIDQELLKEAALILQQISDRIKLLQELKDENSVINENFAHIDRAIEELALFGEAVRKEIKTRE